MLWPLWLLLIELGSAIGRAGPDSFEVGNGEGADQPNQDKMRTSLLVPALNSFGLKKLPAARLLTSPNVG
jgi:hypothetical protein